MLLWWCHVMLHTAGFFCYSLTIHALGLSALPSNFWLTSGKQQSSLQHKQRLG